ncbi:MAG: hypothetical protein K940chlam2_01547, partial [Chlamydiae bacterium]|nr:hypothetical protein [Chlamydiota bacterium]
MLTLFPSLTFTKGNMGSSAPLLSGSGFAPAPLPDYERTVCHWDTENRRATLKRSSKRLWAEVSDRIGGIFPGSNFYTPRLTTDEAASRLMEHVVSFTDAGALKTENPTVWHEWELDSTGPYPSKLKLVTVRGNRLVWQLVSMIGWRTITQTPFEKTACRGSSFDPAEKAKRECLLELVRAYTDSGNPVFGKQLRFITTVLKTTFTVYRTGLERSAFVVTMAPANPFPYDTGELSSTIQRKFYERTCFTWKVSPKEEVRLIRTPNNELIWERTCQPAEPSPFLIIEDVKRAWRNLLNPGLHETRPEPAQATTERIPFEDTYFRPMNRLHEPAGTEQTLYAYEVGTSKIFVKYLATYMTNKGSLSDEICDLIVAGINEYIRVEPVSTVEKTKRVLTVTALYYTSEIDYTYIVTPFDWTVTLICDEGTDVLATHPRNHAALIIESVVDGVYAKHKAHLTIDEEEPVQFKPLSRTLRYSSRTKVYQVFSYEMEKMIAAIMKDKASPPTLNPWGEKNLFASKGSHSCFTWAREKLTIVDVHLHTIGFECIAAITSDWTDTREKHETWRRRVILIAAAEIKADGVY